MYKYGSGLLCYDTACSYKWLPTFWKSMLLLSSARKVVVAGFCNTSPLRLHVVNSEDHNLNYNYNSFVK
jgi:hypothetical protein